MSQADSFDSIVVGGGPAGCSAALWLARLGYRPLLLERSTALGGLQRRSPYANDWLVGWRGGTGQALAEAIAEDVARAGVETRLKAEVERLGRLEKGELAVEYTADGKAERVLASSLVIATGARPRSGGFVPSERVLIGPGESVARLPLAGRRIAILGGGDNALENYLFLEERARSEGPLEALHVYARNLRARAQYLEQVEPTDLRLGPYRADGEACRVEGRVYDTLIVLYGWSPGETFAGPLGLAIDDQGFLQVDQFCRTSQPNVYAVGEIAQRMHPCVATSLADGVVAAKSIQSALEPNRLTALAARGGDYAALAKAAGIHS